jgi:Pretoxin HINT domain
MADGTTKAIKDVKVGDKVTATDPKTGRTAGKAVVTLHYNRDRDLADVSVVDTKGRTATLHTTQHHPFWDSSRRRWVDAASLTAGAALLSASGARETVTSVRPWAGDRYMNDLTVDDFHTYYVVAGDAPVLVHNCGDGGTEVLFGQRRVSPEFSEEGAFKGRSIYAVAEDLKAGRLSRDGVVIHAFEHEGVLVSENTRSLAALSLAGMRPTNIRMMDHVSDEVRGRLTEPPILGPLPSRVVAVTPSKRDLRVGDIISIPDGP